MTFSFLFFAVVNPLLVLLCSPLFMGVVRKVKARAQGKRGPPLLQNYYTLLKLLRKEVVYSSNASWVSRATPYVELSVLLVASLFVPLAFVPSPVDAFGNVLLFLYLLALGKFFLALAGLDAGSTFGGMGSSREMTLSSLIEPVLVLVFAALAFALKTLNLHEMFRLAAGAGVLAVSPALFPLSIAFFIALIAEAARVPVDNPETHLELTMVHEAMVLEQSGRNLALLEMSHSVAQTLLMGVFINLWAPWGLATEGGLGGIAVSIPGFVVKGVLLAAAIGLFESSIAKFRLFRLPTLFVIAFFLSFLSMLLVVLS